MTNQPTNMPNMPQGQGGYSAQQVQVPDASSGAQASGMSTPAPIGAGAGSGVAAATARVEEEKKKKRRRLIIIILLLLALIAGGIGAYFALNQPEDLYDSGVLEGIAPNKTDAEIQAELNRVVDESMFDISIASVIESLDGKTGKAFIENVPGNHYDLQVALVVDGEDDPIFESKLVAPGNYFEDITFTHSLDEGIHNAVAHFKAFDKESHEEIGAVDAQVVISVGGTPSEGGDE